MELTCKHPSATLSAVAKMPDLLKSLQDHLGGEETLSELTLEKQDIFSHAAARKVLDDLLQTKGLQEPTNTSRKRAKTDSGVESYVV